VMARLGRDGNTHARSVSKTHTHRGCAVSTHNIVIPNSTHDSLTERGSTPTALPGGGSPPSNEQQEASTAATQDPSTGPVDAVPLDPSTHIPIAILLRLARARADLPEIERLEHLVDELPPDAQRIVRECLAQGVAS
jgi:hypothetical protein